MKAMIFPVQNCTELSGIRAQKKQCHVSLSTEQFIATKLPAKLFNVRFFGKYQQSKFKSQQCMTILSSSYFDLSKQNHTDNSSMQIFGKIPPNQRTTPHGFQVIYLCQRKLIGNKQKEMDQKIASRSQTCPTHPTNLLQHWLFLENLQFRPNWKQKHFIQKFQENIEWIIAHPATLTRIKANKLFLRLLKQNLLNKSLKISQIWKISKIVCPKINKNIRACNQCEQPFVSIKLVQPFHFLAFPANLPSDEIMAGTFQVHMANEIGLGDAN